MQREFTGKTRVLRSRACALCMMEMQRVLYPYLSLKKRRRAEPGCFAGLNAQVDWQDLTLTG